MAKKPSSKKRTFQGRKSSPLEAKLWMQILAEKLPKPIPEYKFCKERQFRFDFAFIDKKIAIECEGGIWLPRSRHLSPLGYSRDVKKYNLATLLGWKLLRFTKDMIDSGEAIEIIKEALKLFKETNGKED